MTTHQLYDGGPANSTIARTQWPAYPFSATDPKFAEIDASAHQGSGFSFIRRTLDFDLDYMLRNYFTNNAVAAADVLNLILLPPKSILLGLYVEVEVAQGGNYATGAPSALTATFGTANGTIFGNSSGAVALNLANTQAVWSAPGTAWCVAPAAGTVGVAANIGTGILQGYGPDMVQMSLATLATASLNGFGRLRLNLVAPVMQAFEFTASNYRP